MTRVIAHLLMLFSVIILLAIYLPFSFFGEDAYLGWGPIISEYLRGDDIYTNSTVTFGGQNLLGIYGYLPIWKIFRWFNLSFIQVQNLTLSFFYILIFYYVFSLYYFFQKKINLFDFYVLSFTLLLSPILFNRIYSGHINLLFSLLLSFALLDIIIKNSKTSLIINIITFWFSFCIQGYQLLVYNIFYIHLFYVFYKNYGKPYKVILRNFSICLVVGILLAYPALKSMLGHAFDNENIRKIGTSMVYSYAPFSFSDLTHFLFGSFNFLNGPKHPSFFHEITYPIGIFSLLFFTSSIPKNIKISFSLTFIFIILLCAGIPPFSFLAEFPLIKSFRVPQRAFMFLTLLMPIMVLAKHKWDFKIYDLALPAFTVFLFFSIGSRAEVYLFILFLLIWMVIFLKKKKELTNTLIFSSILSLGFSNFDKIPIIKNSYLTFVSTKKVLERAIIEFNKNYDSKNYIFHIDGEPRAQLNATAKILRINTMEGYGHPPLKLIKTYEEITNKKYDIGINHLYFDKMEPNYNLLLKNVGVNFKLKIKNKI